VRHAEIAGAGFAGLAAGIALRQRGWTVRIHERGSELRDFGAGIMIWRNGMLALEALGVGDAIRTRAHRPPFYETRRNHETVSLELGGYPYFTMTRPHLHRTLAEAALVNGVEIVLDSPVAGASPGGVLTLGDGTTLEADLIVGADGAGSQVRDSLALDEERERYIDGVVRLLVARPESFQGAEWDRIIDFWTFEPDVMRILYVPCGKDDLYVAFMAETENVRASRVPIDAEVWQERFPMLADVIARAARVDAGRHDSYQTRKVTPWSSGQVAIVGDAAHAMCPSVAQGACSAFVNSLALAVALEEHPSIPEALSAWESRERGLTDRTQIRTAYMAKTRSFSKGNQWNDDLLETSRHIPTGATQVWERAQTDDSGAYDWARELAPVA
jgi:2-methyl-3-hydroxypyridine 5-carboxylic acid dioxygenase